MLRFPKFALLALCLAATPAAAATNAAETFVSTDIRAGLAILNNAKLSAPERNLQFQNFLIGATDLRRIALYTLGAYAAATPPAQQDAFVAAFQAYAVSVYRAYFQLYSGQSLTVTGSQVRGPDDVIVNTSMASPGGNPPMKIDFRVRTGGPRTVITDIGISGVWLALAQHDDFAGFLSQHKGDVAALTAHLNQAASAAPPK